MRALDNMNYRRTKKILLSDPNGELSEEGESSVAENDDDDDKSLAVSYLLLDLHDVEVVVHKVMLHYYGQNPELVLKFFLGKLNKFTLLINLIVLYPTVNLLGVMQKLCTVRHCIVHLKASNISMIISNFLC